MAEHENFSANKYEKANFCWHFHIYLQRKVHAQLSRAWKKFCKVYPFIQKENVFISKGNNYDIKIFVSFLNGC